MAYSYLTNRLLLLFLLNIITVEFVLPSGGNYTFSKYYQSTSIQIQPMDNASYKIDFNLSKEITPPKEIGQYRFTEKRLSQMFKTMAIIQYGLDFKPLWEAVFKRDKLSHFIEYRKDESRVFSKSNPISKYYFKEDRLIKYYQFIDNTLYSECFEFDASKTKIISQTSLINNKTNLIKQFKFNQQKPDQVNVYKLNNNKLNLLYYYSLSPLKKSNGLFYQKVTYFNEDHLQYNQLTEFYKENKLVQVDSSHGYSIVYDWQGNHKTTRIQVDKAIKSITTSSFRSTQNEIFPLFTKPESVFLIRYEKIDLNPTPISKTYSWLSPRGFLNKETTFYFNNSSIYKFQKRLYPRYIYEVHLTKDGQIKRKNIFNEKYETLGYYLYTYNDQQLIEEQRFFDFQGTLQNKVKYFYHPSNTNSYLVSYRTVLDKYQNDIYYFSYHGLEKDLRERINNRAYDFRHREKSIEYKQSLLSNLMTAHRTKLKKVIYYNQEGEVSSYIRLDSKPVVGSSNIHLKIYYYSCGVKFNFKTHKGNSFYKHDFIKNQKNQIDTVGRQYEFHNRTIDDISKSKQQKEFLKETYAFEFDNNKVFSFAKEMINPRTGKLLKKTGFTPTTPYFETNSKSTYEAITEEFIEGLISPN